MRKLPVLSACVALLIAAGCSSTVMPPSDAAAAGGAGGGGTGGQAAHDGGDPCTSLPAAYAQAFVNARSCSPFLDNLQCAQTASASLQCPNCPLHVNDTTVLDQIRATWSAAHCPPLPCPAILCVAPGTGACIANDGGPTGTCVEVY
jgi:hypothetical protein